MKIQIPTHAGLCLALLLALYPSAVHANNPPILDQPADMTMVEGGMVDHSQVLSATDIDGDPLTFSLVSGPTFAMVTTTSAGTGTASGLIHMSVGPSDVGTFPATVAVTDNIDTDTKTLTITVLMNMPDPTVSYFVPESGSVTSPLQGAAAIASARRCPNDDGIQVLRLAARLKIVVIGTNTLPMAGIAPSDICVRFNGGTGLPSPPNQGFTGPGDDSIIATSFYNPLANCPDIRCVPADAPTDANGVAYITWIGHAPGDPPGVVTNQSLSRDPFRKWGGYAGDIPVLVLGVQLQGKLTDIVASPLGSYTAHVKDLDSIGGRTTIMNQGELVNSLDINPVQAAIGHPYKYNLDFDNNGVINVLDLNFVKAHNMHKCDLPIVN
jgi:hypothetical protein